MDLWYCVDIPVMESGLSDRAKAGSSLRHWPPGTNSKPFVPPFFALDIFRPTLTPPPWFIADYLRHFGRSPHDTHFRVLLLCTIRL
jgi:hypothetical protein